MRLASALIGGLLCLPLLASVAATREIDPAERREVPYDSHLPACSDLDVLNEISQDFATRESRFWNSSLRIVAFERIRQQAWRPWGLDYIPRRYCSAMVVVSDGRKRRIDFSVREDLGPIGISWDAEWCITGLDRNYAFAPGCKQAQP